MCLLLVDLLWSGIIPATGLHDWHSPFRLACLLVIVEMLISFHVYRDERAIKALRLEPALRRGYRADGRSVISAPP